MLSAPSRWDSVGQAVSGLCIAHCVLLPLVLGLLPLAAAELLEAEGVHHALIVLAAVGALAAFIPGWRLHRDTWVPALAALGLALLASGAFLVPEAETSIPWETFLTLGGGVGMALAHGRNRSLRRRCCPP